MQFKITFITEQKTHTIKAVRTVAMDYGFDGMKGLREAKDAVEQGIIVYDSNLVMMIQLLDKYFKRQVKGIVPVCMLKLVVELAPNVSLPIILPFNNSLVSVS